jgi:hypothetical protein
VTAWTNSRRTPYARLSPRQSSTDTKRGGASTPSIHAYSTIHTTTKEIHDVTTTTDTPMRNGVDTATLFATLDAAKANPDIADSSSERPIAG